MLDIRNLDKARIRWTQNVAPPLRSLDKKGFSITSKTKLVEVISPPRSLTCHHIITLQELTLFTYLGLLLFPQALLPLIFSFIFCE